MTTLETSPGVEDVSANHCSAEGSIEYNPPGRFVAILGTFQVTADIILHPPNLATMRSRLTQSAT